MWYKNGMPRSGPPLSTGSVPRRLGLAAIVFVFAVGLALGLAGTTRPPGTFMKYPDATVHRDPSRIQDYSPLYLSLTRVLYPVGGIRLMRVTQTLLFAAAASAVAVAVELEAGFAAGLAAGAFMASYRPFLVYAAVLEPETLILFLLAVALLAAIRVRTEDRLEKGTLSASVAAGSLALAALARPQFIVLVPVWIWWMARERKGRNRRTIVVAAAAIATLIVAPFAGIRLARVGSLSVMDPGTVFYEGNGPQSPTGTFTQPAIVKRLQELSTAGADAAHVAYRRVASAEAGRPLTRDESNRYWAGLALSEIAAHPGRAAARFASKALLAWGPAELHDLVNAEDLDRRIRRRLPWGWGVLLVGLVVVAPGIRRRLFTVLGPISLIGLAWAVQVIFYPSARQRLPMVLAAVVVVAVAAPASRVRWRCAAVQVGLGLAIFVVVTWVCAPAAVFHGVDLGSGLRPLRGGRGEALAACLDGRSWRPGVGKVVRAMVEISDSFDSGRAVGAASPEAAALRAGTSGPGWLRSCAAYWVARSYLADGGLREASIWVGRACRLDPENLRARALLRVLEAAGCGALRRTRRHWPGADLLDADLALVEAVGAAYGPACTPRVAPALFAAFPELAATRR